MEVIKAETAGFCMGVSLALRRLDQALEARHELIAKGETGTSRLFTLGPIIHNPQLVREYEERGAICLEDPQTARGGDTVIIRAHGLPLDVEECLLRERGVTVIDATCPKVKAAQLLIWKEAKAGGRLLLFGEAEHPEVKGLLSYAGQGSHVFGSIQELKEMELRPGENWFVAAQTTQDKSIFQEVIKFIRAILGDDVMVLETICGATGERQAEVVRLAERVRSMVIVGGLNSGNTTRLAEIAKNLGVFTVHCENGYDLPLDKLKTLQPVGLSAGASTPNEQIRAVELLLLQA